MKLEYSVEEPLNREPPIKELVHNFISIDDQYDRNHGPIPHINAEDHFIRVDGNVCNELELSMDQLRCHFKQYEIVSALQCAGNRRHTMRTLLKVRRLETCKVIIPYPQIVHQKPFRK